MWLTITITFLDGTFHGRGDRNLPEWPPSPLRLFQALVAVADTEDPTHGQALDFLAALPTPEILAAPAEQGTPFQTSVPNNAMDLIAKSRSRGNDANPAKHRAMKTIHTTYLRAEPARQQVRFLWRLTEQELASQHLRTLQAIAARLYALGWGLDLVAAHAEMSDWEVDSRWERWLPAQRGGTRLRVPTSATQAALRNRHHSWQNRLTPEGILRTVPALPTTAYQAVDYARDWQTNPPAVAAFSLLNDQASGYRLYDLSRGLKLAGMLRHLTRRVAEQSGRVAEFVSRIVLGHAESRGDQHQPVGLDRFAYLPLPSLEPRKKGQPANHVSAIRRCLITLPSGNHPEEIDWLKRSLPGNVLIPEDSSDPDTLLSLLPTSDKIVQRYLAPRKVWVSVTPVVLPGHDDRKPRKTEKLVRKAIRQAGLPAALAESAEIQCQHAGFLPGAMHAKRYFVPRYLKDYPRYHVRISWAKRALDQDNLKIPLALPGPLAIGGGRFAGLGLFAGLPDPQ